LRVRSQGFDEAKYQLRGWFIVVALYDTSNTRHNRISNESFKAIQQTVGRKSSLGGKKFLTASNRMKVPLIRKPASGTKASNGGRKISTKTVRKKRLPVVVMS